MTPEERVLEIQRKSVNMALTGREVWESIRTAIREAESDAIAAALRDRDAEWGQAVGQAQRCGLTHHDECECKALRALLEEAGK